MYSDFKANFDEVLEKDGCFSIDHRNIQTLAVEIFKFFNELSATIMKYFRLSHQPHTAWGIRTVTYGTESISFLTLKFWSIVPQEIKKNCKSLTVCSYHVTYAFQSGSTLCSCLNVKELLARNRCKFWNLSDCNGTRIHNHLVRKQTKWLSVHLQTKWLWVRIPLQSCKSLDSF